MGSSKHSEEYEGLLAAKRSARRPSRYMTWGVVFWPLIGHSVIAVVIALLMICYVDGNNFNIDSRKPSVTLADGTVVPWVRYTPLQSDITTLVSTSLAFLRLITACWLGPLSWRCAFILLETTGLRGGQLYAIVAYGIPTPPRRDRRMITFSIFVILVIVLPIYFVAPILTGSITWIPSQHRPERLSGSMISIPDTNTGIGDRMRTFPDVYRQRMIESTVGLALAIWGRDPRSNAMSRAHKSIAPLAINSTLTSVVLPYLTVTSLEWIRNPEQELTLEQREVTKYACPKLNLQNETICAYSGFWNRGMFALIPDAPWINTPYINSSQIVTEKRLMALYNGDKADLRANICRQTMDFLPGDPIAHEGIVGDPSDNACWAFAWMNYTAGAGLCHNCRVSSYATVQNETGLELIPDYLADTALHMIPNIIDSMMKVQSDYMRPSWDNIDDYVIGLFSRAYAASWVTIAAQPARRPWVSGVLNTTYSVSPPASQAVVNASRVYIWLGLQGLITVSGILFVFVQAASGSPMIGDTTLAAFFLDSSSVCREERFRDVRGGSVRTVESGAGFLKVKLD